MTTCQRIGGNVYGKFKDPDGIILDLSHLGWVGASEDLSSLTDSLSAPYSLGKTDGSDRK